MTLGWADMNYAQAPVIKEVQDYITYDGFIRTGIGLYLYGDMGTGKTTLASLAARKFLADGHDVYMTSFTSLLDAFTSTWRDNEERKWFYRRVKNSRILFIDDLGREGSQRTTTTTAMDDVLRHRVSSGLVTCMTSNLAPGEISGRYGTNVFDLLTECSSPVEFKWTAQEESKRLAVKARRNFEIKNKLVRPLVLG
jgi:DNA replication protein DnaC